MRVGVLCSRVRVEEKLLFEAMRNKGIEYEKIDDREIIFQLNDKEATAFDYDVILERVVSVCNAPSPAATASLNIGRLIVDKLAERF